MPKILEVVFVGKSLLLAGLAASLKDNHQFRITQMELSMAAAAVQLALIVPDVIIFETNAVDLSPISALLCEFPGIKLIALEGMKASMILISGRPVENINDLAAAITG